MSYKTILVHVEPGKHRAAPVDVAIRMAIQQGAHLVALYVQSPLVLPGYLIHIGPEIIEAQKKAAAEEMMRAKESFSKQLSAMGFDNAEWRSFADFPQEAITKQARYADLIVIGQLDPAENAGMAENLTARLVPAAGRPLLIVPYIGSFPSIGKRILIAWNSSREATRAITDALPILKSAENVTLMEVSPKHDDHQNEPDEDMALYLSRHGVHVDVMMDHAADIDVGNELLSRAADLSADLLVMGGYGHSRLKEWVLGGTTRTILESMTLPVLMSH